MMKEFEMVGEENIQQAVLVNKMVQKLMISDDSGIEVNQEAAIELSKKLSNVVAYLINKE